MSSSRTALIMYGLDKIAKASVKTMAGFSLPKWEIPEINWGEYEQLLGSFGVPETILTSIFNRIQLTDQPTITSTLTHKYFPPRKLTLAEEVIIPKKLEDAHYLVNPRRIGVYFENEFEKLLERYGNNESALFEGFYHLYRKWAWGLPCTYGEAGVSLFEQWKAIASLVFASSDEWVNGPAEKFTLLGGDFPGIQDFVYTITSKGAAKGLRGRSFFIQLLGDAVIQRIVTELRLSRANVIYSAGGNFMILGPSLDTIVDNASAEVILSKLVYDLESSLLDALQGDLSICLAWTELDAKVIGSHGFATEASRTLKEKIAQKKRQRYQNIAEERWQDIFDAQGRPGNRYCVVCQQPLGIGEGIELPGQEEIPADQKERRCPNCQGFQQLAERIGKPGLWSVSNTPRLEGSEYWQQTLWRVSHKWYAYGRLNKLLLSPDSVRYTVNNTEFIQAGAHGFQFIANVTPRVTRQDVERYETGQEHDPEDERPVVGTIRTFSQMADSAQGMHRLGVLRMDVDNLGQIMVRGLQPRTMAATSALSSALDLFFAGYVNHICKQIEGHDGGRLYAIYAGGDDLFLVGSWDLIPTLAQEIHQQFSQYTCQNPDVNISAGITLEDRKFPLYQAAERAGKAEEQAKQHKKDGFDKDSIFYLGLPIKWADWQYVIKYKQDILSALEDEQAPKALVQVLQDIYTQYLGQIQEHNKQLIQSGGTIPDEAEYQIYYGPWMWRSGYALTRMRDRVKDERVKNLLLELQRASTDKYHIRYIGLAARWAELLTKKED